MAVEMGPVERSYGLNLDTIGNDVGNFFSGIDYGSLAPALGSLLTAGSTAMDIEARGEAAVAGIDRAADEFLTQENIMEQQGDEINRAVGDQMTSRNLQALKDFSLAKALAVETNTSGGTTANTVHSIWMTSSLDNANTIQAGRKAKVDIERKSIANKLSFENKVATIQGTMLSGGQAALKTVASGASGFAAGYSMMPDYKKENLFTF